MNPLLDASGTEVAGLLAAGAISSRELVQACLAQADAVAGQLGAFITRLDEQALAWAEQADQLRRTGDPRPLLGIPFAIKDLHPAQGIPCTLGSAAIRFTPDADSEAVGLLRDAGLIPIATTNACEFGPTCTTSTPMAGRALSPWGTELSAAGSSGGSAAAVAARILPWAHASDGAGSIRLPASVCGLVGLKPSRGRVPAQSPSYLDFGVEGALTRTVSDTRVLFNTLAAKPGTGHLHPAPGPVATTGPLRIALCVDPGLPVVPEPACLDAARHAAIALERRGHNVTEVKHPLGEHAVAAVGCFLDLTSASIFALVSSAVPADRHHLLAPYTRWLHERGRQLDAGTLHRGQIRLAGHAAAANTRLAAIDVLITPTAAGPPFVADRFDHLPPSEAYTAMASWAAWSPIANWTGRPAISLPTGQTHNGLPIGVQLLGTLGNDEILLDLAETLETDLPWSSRSPSVCRR